MNKILALFAIVSLSGCAGLEHQELKKGAEEPSLRIIDVHTHLRAIAFEEKKDNASILKDFDEEWKNAGVVGAIAHTNYIDEYGYIQTPGKNIVHCAGIKEVNDYRKLERSLKSGQFKCIKVYLGYLKLYASAPAYQKAYKLAEKYHVPVVFHTGDIAQDTGELKYSDPLTIDEVAVKFKKVNFVIAHCGNPWIESAAEVAYKNENVYLDGSAFVTGDLSTMPPEKIEEYMVKPLKWIFGYVENPDKIMFGTDWPFTHIAPYVEAFKKAIPKQYWQKVFHDNAVKVFGVEP